MLLLLAAGECPLLAQAAYTTRSSSHEPASSSSAAAAPRCPSQQQLALFRLQKLALLCLSTLAAGGPEAAALSSPYASLSSLQQQQPAAAMLDFIIKLVNPDTWTASIRNALQKQQQQQDPGQSQASSTGAADEAAAAAAGAEAVLKHLVSKHLTAHLRMLLLAVQPGAPPKTCAEVCVTQLVVRALKLQLVPYKAAAPANNHAQSGSSAAAAAAAASSDTSTASAAGAAAAAAVQHGVCQLLFVPGLWSKVPSLVPVAGRLCSLSLGELALLQSSKQLVDVLLLGPGASSGSSSAGRPSVPQHTRATGADAAAVAVTAVVENLVEAAAAGVLLKSLNQAEQVSVAGKLVAVLVTLLDAARQLSVTQRRLWRSKSSRHQQQQQGRGGRSIYDLAGPSSSASKKAGYVPGAGFVAPKAPQAMEVDGDAAAAGQAAAATADATTEAGSAAMEVDGQQTGATAAAEAATGGEAPATAAGEQTETEAAAAAAVDVQPGTAGTASSTPAAGATGAVVDAARSRKADAADAAIIEQPVAASAWSAEQQSGNGSAESEVTATEAGMQLLAGSNKGLQLLRLLVATLLPATTAAEGRALQQQAAAASVASAAAGQAVASQAAGAAPAGVLLPGCSAQHMLLELVWSLSRAPEYRQKVLLGLSVSSRLVPRLWYSLVLPLHLATPGGLLYYSSASSSSSSNSSGGGAGGRRSSTGGGAGSSSIAAADAGGLQAECVGGWMLPMLVLCQSFSAALSFTHVEDFYSPEGSSCLVPLAQLYDQAAPAAGLVLLVKAALWQVS